MIYYYRICSGVASLNKGDNHKIKTIGKFKTDKEAKEACIVHFEKACKACENLGKEKPTMYFI